MYYDIPLEERDGVPFGEMDDEFDDESAMLSASCKW